MALLTTQQLSEVGTELSFSAASTNGDQATGDEDLFLVAKVGATASEVQVITVLGSPTGGTFKLSFDGQTTDNFIWGPSYATALIEVGLESLSNIETADVAVTGPNGGPYVVTFSGQYANEEVPTIVPTDVNLTGGTTPSISVTTQTPGVGSEVLVTILGQAECSFGYTHDRTITVPSGEERYIGPLPQRFWDENGKVNVTYSSAGGVSIAAVKV
jgi:hypothetical protein